MAFVAGHRGVLAEQRKFSGRVIELARQSLGRDQLPTCGVVTGLTGCAEASVMRIGMAIVAPTKRQADKFRQLLGPFRNVAFRASALCMRSRKWITGPGMIEPAH